MEKSFESRNTHWQRHSLLDEVVAADELLEAVVLRVLFKMIAQLLPLLLQNIGHVLIHLLKQLVHLWQQLQGC